jgi:hypothetical protein
VDIVLGGTPPPRATPTVTTTELPGTGDGPSSAATLLLAITGGVVLLLGLTIAGAGLRWRGL